MCGEAVGHLDFASPRSDRFVITTELLQRIPSRDHRAIGISLCGNDVDLLPRHQGPGDPSRLVGERHCRDLRGLALEQACHARLARRILACHPHNRRRSDDQQAAKIAVALLGYSAEPLLAARTVRTRSEPEPGRELST